jgi:hypothetical protein
MQFSAEAGKKPLLISVVDKFVGSESIDSLGASLNGLHLLFFPLQVRHIGEHFLIIKASGEIGCWSLDASSRVAVLPRLPFSPAARLMAVMR